MSPRPLSFTAAAVWFALVVSAGTGIFVAGVAIANRLYPVKP